VKVLMLSVLVFGFVFYAGYVEPHWIEVTRSQIGQPNGNVPLVIAQISDLHLHEVGTLEQTVTQHLREIHPDLIVLSGDVVDRRESLESLDEFLRGIVATHKVAVLGNWEYWSEVDLAQLRKIYKDRGVELLVNETARFSIKGRALVVHGVDDYTAGNPRIHIKKSQPTETTILVQHSPGFFQENLSELNEISLCLSGHTHGGQITAFGWPLWKPQGSGKFASGLYDTATCPLYVSRGIGTSILNFRFGARPEIAVFTI
jgi:predicted MPP superfamily phosphohydrolase